MNGLSIEHLFAGYKDITVLHDISLATPPRETLVLMGTSGSGKTTLLLTILGINPVNQGQILLNGQVLNDISIEERGIGYLPQDYGLFPHLNVFGNVAYGLAIRGYAHDAQARIVTEMLELVGLPGLERRRTSELSGGQRQRIGLARALAIRPKLLLLDEPLSSIDQVTRYEVASNLKELFAKLDIPIILVTHSHEDASFFSKSIAVMIDGKIAQHGSFEALTSSPQNPVVKRLLMPFHQ